MRLFAAVSFGTEFRDALLAHQEELKRIARANWSRPENLHLTLAFLGELPSAHPVIKALAAVEFPAYPVTLGAPGRFGAVRWVGIEDGGQTVLLAREVRAALDGAGIPYDPKPLKPHITVAREFRASAPGLTLPPLRDTVRSFALYRSDRTDGRLVYTKLWEKPLRV